MQRDQRTRLLCQSMQRAVELPRKPGTVELCRGSVLSRCDVLAVLHARLHCTAARKPAQGRATEVQKFAIEHAQHPRAWIGDLAQLLAVAIELHEHVLD